MGWAVGYDDNWGRDIGYGIIAFCDHPDCNEEIDRGLAYVCAGEQLYGGEGCGLYFCGKHLASYKSKLGFSCERCGKGKKPFQPKPEHPLWIRFKLIDLSWGTWRKECPDEAKEFQTMWDRLSPEIQDDANTRTVEEIKWQEEL